VQEFFIRDQDWMVFAALTHRNKLVLPKAPHGFAVTGFLLGCLGKQACHAPNKKALNTSCWGLCALCWTEFERNSRRYRYYIKMCAVGILGKPEL